MKAESALTAEQIAVSRRVLGEEEAKREHLVIYLSGAHAYGFPSPDSDLDMKAIHIEKTEKLLGFGAPRTAFDRAEVIDGVEIDYTANEIGPALAGVLLGNGNYLERLLGALTFTESPRLASLRPLVLRSLSRRVHRHYRGFASTQRGALQRTPTVKKLLYVLRTAWTGAHVLRAGEVIADLTVLAGIYGLAGVAELVERKKQGERTPLEGAELERWGALVEHSFEGLDQALVASKLPEESPNAAELEAWLIELRKSAL